MISKKLFEITVIVPCYNEKDNISALCQRLSSVFEKESINGQIILVNDASQDDTGPIADRLSKEFPFIKVVHHEMNQGIAAGWRSGLTHAEGTFSCLIDADLQYLPEDIPRLLRTILQKQCDMVQGYRSSIGRKRDYRFYLSRGLNFLLNSIFSMRLKDNKSGFVVARTEQLTQILKHKLKYHYFQTFIAVSAHSKGFAIEEVETLFQERFVGKSFINSFPLKLILRCLSDLLKGFYEFRLGTSSDPILDDFLRNNPTKKEPDEYKGARKVLLDVFFGTMPLHKWMITKQTKPTFLNLRRSQWLSREQIRKLQEEKLHRLVRHCYLHVPYYRKIMEERNLKPDNFRTLESLSQLPLLSKSDFRKNLYFDLFATNHRKDEMLKISTSGSTGEPFVCYADRKQLEIRLASTMRSMEWTGWRFGDTQARLWHQTIGMSFGQIMREKLDAVLNRRLFIPAFEMTDENLPKFFERLKRHKPYLIDGYAESFNFLAYYSKKFPDHLCGFQPRAIISSAQSMPEDTRQTIEREFQTKVYDKYGSREFSGIAYECGHGIGHHIVAESYIVEVLKDGVPARDGEIGEVVITDLNNFGTPFIRYRIGDLAVAVNSSFECPCGRGLPLVGRIEGRVQSIILGSNGSWMPGTFFLHLLKDYDYAIRMFQIIQNVRGEIDLKIVKGPQCNSVTIDQILGSLREFLGVETKINLFYVDEIPLGRTGKRASVISNLIMDFQGGIQ